VLDVFFNFFATLLSWFYELWPSYGVSVILLTIAVMLLVTPLTLKGTRSMLELQMHQPELRKIQTQYRDDRQKMNEELMKFYSEHKINPVGGCLPLLIQLPVFIILYNVIRGLTQRTSLVESVLSGKGAQIAGTFDPKYIDHSSELYKALHGTSKMASFGIDLARTPIQAMGDGLGTAWPYLLLVVAIAITSYVQQKQIQGRNTGQINPQMQMITKVMPLIFVFFSLNFPAALAVYWCTSGLWRIGQQYIIGKHIYTEDARTRLADAKERGASLTTTGREAAAAAAPQPGGFFGRLMANAQAQQEARSGSNGDGGGGGRGSRAAAAGAGSGRSSSTSSSPSTPPARPSSGGGRVTTPGSRPAAARKKKKRK
jgi:YidC/Oxa1 family membrane protein insertase